jgi:hypothetical protein
MSSFLEVKSLFDGPSHKPVTKICVGMLIEKIQFLEIKLMEL